MKDEMEFLRESNAIEGVYDGNSLMEAKEAWDYLMIEDVVTLDIILNAHMVLMKSQDIEDKYKGAFRDIDVWVAGGKGAMPAAIPMLLQWQFCFETMRVAPPPDWKQLHVIFEKIHPFVDGNGRIGRMLMNWTRVKRCNLPILVIEADKRQEYYEWFRLEENCAYCGAVLLPDAMSKEAYQRHYDGSCNV